MTLDRETLKRFGIGLLAGVAAPLIVEYIKKQLKKREDASQVQIPANTDHGFVAWVGDDNFFELEGDTSIENNPHMSLVPLTSRERMRNYPTFKKYQPFNVTPAKKIKLT
jgi:hypothetical protein